MADEKPLMCPRRDEVAAHRANIVGDHDEWREDGTCSFCGSMKPADMLSAIESGEKVTPTDKNYKAYVGSRKVYFQHFDKPDQDRLIDLMNNSKISFEYPGYFYRLPFFVRGRPKSEGSE